MSPGWVAATVAIAGALWGIGKVVFGVVSRQELKDTIEALKKEWKEKHEDLVEDLARKHRDNEKNFRESFRRMGKLETGVARVQERLSIPNRREHDPHVEEEGADDDGA